MAMLSFCNHLANLLQKHGINQKRRIAYSMLSFCNIILQALRKVASTNKAHRMLACGFVIILQTFYKKIPSTTKTRRMFVFYRNRNYHSDWHYNSKLLVQQTSLFSPGYPTGFIQTFVFSMVFCTGQ